MVGERDVLPGATGGVALAADDLEPCGLAQLGMLGAAIRRPERALREVGEGEVRDEVAARLEEPDRVVALHHGPAAQLRAHPTPQRLGVQHALGHARHQELPVGVTAQRPLLP